MDIFYKDRDDSWYGGLLCIFNCWSLNFLRGSLKPESIYYRVP